MSSTSHISNANESTLPLSNYCDSTVRDQKLEKEIRNYSVTCFSTSQNDDEGRVLNSKKYKQKAELTKPIDSTRKESSKSNRNRDSGHSSDKLLAYLKLQSYHSQLQPTFVAYCSPVLKRNISIGEIAGLKAYKTKMQSPLSPRITRSSKKDKILLQDQASSRKDLARGRTVKPIQDNIGNFSARKTEKTYQSDLESLSQLFVRKHSMQYNETSRSNLLLTDTTGILGSSIVKNAAKTSRRKQSISPEPQESLQLARRCLAKTVSDTRFETETRELSKNKEAVTERVPNSSDKSGTQLLALMNRVDSIFLRYEKEEHRLQRTNQHLLQLLDKKIAEKHLLEKRK